MRSLPSTLELVLFENDATRIKHHLDSGLSSFLIDLEILGKDLRQLGFNTEIRPGTLEDLRAIAAQSAAKVWCRLNRFGSHTPEEVNLVLAAGADVVMLPMITTISEVATFIDLVGQRCEIGLMIETLDGVRLAPKLSRLSIDYVFFGLNDFAISRGGGSIFQALLDGSVEKVRQAIPDIRFGVGGLTDLRQGHPIPSFRLLEEINRLGCDFTFLRRSFRKDSESVPASEIVQGIQSYWQQCSLRSDTQRRQDHDALATLVRDFNT